MTLLSNLVWPTWLAGEARRRAPLAIPRPVFVAQPGRPGAAAEPPCPALLVAWLHRTDGGEPTHAEVVLADGTLQHYAAAWVQPRPRLAVVGGRAA